jgi:hypothetical protein
MTTLMDTLRYELGVAGEEAADRIEELEQQLAKWQESSANAAGEALALSHERDKLRKQNVLLRNALEGSTCKDVEYFAWLKMKHDALAATTDLAGMVVCDAMPAAFVVEGDQDGHKDLDFLFSVIDPLPVGTKLYVVKEKS